MWMEKRGKFWGFSSVCPPAAGSHAALAANGKTPKVSIFFCFVLRFLLFYSSVVDPLLSGCASTYMRVAWFGGWNQPSPVPSQRDTLLPASVCFCSIHREDNRRLPAPPASRALPSLYRDSDCWIWIWMLNKRQDHFNPLATASCNWSLQSAQWSIHRWCLMYPHDSPQGNSEGHYPQFTGQPTRLIKKSWNLPPVTVESVLASEPRCFIAPCVLLTVSFTHRYVNAPHSVSALTLSRVFLATGWQQALLFFQWQNV